MTPYILSIAASDSSGGAGIQRDLRTAIAFDCWLLSTITGVTVQDFMGLHGIEAVSADFIQRQIEKSLHSFDVRAIKIGAICSRESFPAIAHALQNARNIVLDPVIAPTVGKSFVEGNVIDLYQPLLRVARLITPNRNELETLSGRAITSYDQASDAAIKMHERYGCSVLIKGGHFENEPLRDILIDNGREYHYAKQCRKWHYTHGTGCTLSTAIAACLARGMKLPEAVKVASQYLEKEYDRLNSHNSVPTDI